MNSYELSPKARKHIAAWSRDDYYVYIRPTTSKHAEPTKPEGQWWVVAVQVRHMPPHEFRQEGRCLDTIICEMGKRVPRRKDLGKLDKPTHESYESPGFLAPKVQYDRYVAGISGDETKSAALKAAVQDVKARKKKAMSKKGSAAPMHDRVGPSIMANEEQKKAKKKKSKKGKKK